jgi:hypothetical protein
MTAVPLADAARLLGKPERTVRRWAAKGRLSATRTVDGWLVNLELDEHGQVAATDRSNGHAHGRAVTPTAATGGQLATVPVSYLLELQTRAEAAAYWQGRADLLGVQLEQAQRALAAPREPAPDELQRASEAVPAEPAQQPAEHQRPWWRFW